MLLKHLQEPNVGCQLVMSFKTYTMIYAVKKKDFYRPTFINWSCKKTECISVKTVNISVRAFPELKQVRHPCRCVIHHLYGSCSSKTLQPSTLLAHVRSGYTAVTWHNVLLFVKFEFRFECLLSNLTLRVFVNRILMQTNITFQNCRARSSLKKTYVYRTRTLAAVIIW